MYHYNSANDYLASGLYQALTMKQVVWFSWHTKWQLEHKGLCPFVNPDGHSCRCGAWTPAFQIEVPFKSSDPKCLEPLKTVLTEIRRSWGPGFTEARLVWTRQSLVVPNCFVFIN